LTRSRKWLARTATTLETGVSHDKRRLHKARYFRELLAINEEVMFEASRA
jgi:hypothetical protein